MGSLFLLPGCFVLQDAYDDQATAQCDELIDTVERLDCRHQAEQEARDRRMEKRQER
ncbi:MAG: hypothetical protein QNI84_10105 [Henriciella sp.]|nr:hypothetical protein [Henriciella sp.]